MVETHEPAGGRPQVVDADANRRFRESARRHQWDPDDQFVGGYVDWEWQHGRHVFDGLFTSVAGKKVLEVGSHFGGTAIVLAALGADVTAIDVDPQFVELTALNAERYGFEGRIHPRHVGDTTKLPFPDGAFDLVSCNSVLEYVPPEILGAMLGELDRVLARRGFVVIFGTSNRLWPHETHSDRWLMNYVPHRLRPLFPGKRVESVSPFRLRAGFPGYEELTLRDGGRLFVELKARMGTRGRRLRLVEGVSRLLAPLRMHVGYVSRTITMVLQKP